MSAPNKTVRVPDGHAVSTPASGHEDACPCPISTLPAKLLEVALACTRKRWPVESCVYEATNASVSYVPHLRCMQWRNPSAPQGLFVVSLSDSGKPVCTGGDVYHVSVLGQTSKVTGHTKSRFAAVAEPLLQLPFVYWADTRGAAAAASDMYQQPQLYELQLRLLSTQNRAVQRADGRGPLRWNLTGGSFVGDWVRDFICLPTPAVSLEGAVFRTRHGAR